MFLHHSDLHALEQFLQIVNVDIDLELAFLFLVF